MKKILLISYNNGEISTQMRELGFTENILLCTPTDSFVYSSIRNNRPDFVFLDTCMGERVAERLFTAIESAKWGFDIALNIALIGPKLTTTTPGAYYFKSFQEAKIEISKQFA